MKKKTKKILISVSIIITLIFLGAYFSGNLPFTILSKASYVNANNLGNGVWDLSGADPNANPVAGIQSSNGKFDFVINKYGGSTRQDAKTSLRLESIKFNSQVASFLSTHSNVNSDQSACKYGFYQPFDAGWDSKIGVTKYDLGYGNMGWCLSEVQVSNILDNGFVVFEGSYATDCSTIINVRTYGICKSGTSCYLYDPAPQVEGVLQGGSPDCLLGVLTPTSWKLYFKEGGYTEESGKAAFGFFTMIDVYRLESNVCNKYNIKENEKTLNDYLTSSECESKIIVQPPIDESGYNLINNKCESVSSNAQYKTLDECNLYVIVGSKGYIVENDVCKYVESNPKFNTQIECEDSLKPINPPKNNLLIWISVGISILVIVLIIFLFVRRK